MGEIKKSEMRPAIEIIENAFCLNDIKCHVFGVIACDNKHTYIYN